MDRKDRNFGKQFKEYREEYLDIKQLEAAERLSISSSALSNYETKNRDLTPDMLAEIKRTFDIPDDYFLAMIMGEPLRDVKSKRHEHAGKTNEIRTHYRNQFIEQHRGLLEESNELREVIAIASSLSAKQRRIYFNSIKSNIAVFKSFIDKNQ
ncbi:helix-turn-helix domain-containing protein [Sporosarcina aquimarina]|uniref:Helix-turn-helix transcriptional regulator n=1 Tax=Sporosarcina aquimarina TaxID=114975 RepID=A0ABU4FX53_9BACL|nr:helix-turn-helix transcriptional regulator [Sporosarcina aquimarina]MDW0108668.1 helix-turn-helix transcriptional regulator [Sporosarcina aquimarina]